MFGVADYTRTSPVRRRTMASDDVLIQAATVAESRLPDGIGKYVRMLLVWEAQVREPLSAHTQIAEKLAYSILAAPSPAESDGAALIAAERRRQVEVEGWDAEHDDRKKSGSLAQAALCYVVGNDDHWPWSGAYWKPTGDRVRDLVKAAALLAAEIDRLQRAERGAS